MSIRPRRLPTLSSTMQSLVLIPGLLCEARLWSNQITTLARYADITVADITQQSTITEMADAVLQTSPPQFSLAGFSLGSQVALEVMRVSKDRVERLALLSATQGGLLPPVEMANSALRFNLRNADSTEEWRSFALLFAGSAIQIFRKKSWLTH
jgi:pimeloyl-ACP methyl ester carboxylesterase